jgi:hypothetical protein
MHSAVAFCPLHFAYSSYTFRLNLFTPIAMQIAYDAGCRIVLQNYSTWQFFSAGLITKVVLGLRQQIVKTEASSERNIYAILFPRLGRAGCLAAGRIRGVARPG